MRVPHVVAALLLFWLTGLSASAQTVLMFTDTSTLNAGETARRTQLQTWGFTVNTILDSASQATIDAAVAAADVVYIPCTVTDWELADKLRTCSKGVVCEERYLDDNFGLSTAPGWDTTSYTQISITNNTHEITSSFNTGNLTIFNSSGQPMTLMNPTFASGLTILAEQHWGNKALTVVDIGATLANTVAGNSTAAGRRVHLPWGGDSFNWNVLNSDGLLILQKSLQWATGKRLLLHYKLDHTSGTSVTDSSGGGNTGTVTGTASWVSAVRDNGFDFNGTTKIQTNSELGNPANVSMAAWVDLDAPDSSGAEIVSIGDHVNFRLTANSVRAVLYNGSTWLTTSATFAPVGAGWHHYAFTFDDASDTLKIYIDGDLVTTATVTATISYSGHGTATVVGRHGNGAAIYDMDGRIDDVRIYNYALSPAEIAAVYGLVGHYKLNETAGTTASDSSGAGNNGTVTGTTGWSTAVRGNGHRFNYTNGDDYVTIPNSTTLQDVQEDDYSLSMWFKPASVPPGTGLANDAIYGLAMKNGMICGLGYTYEQKFRMAHPFSDGSILQAYSANTFGSGSFHHVVVVVKRATGNVALYVNGQLESSQSFTPNKEAFEQGTSTWKLGIASPGSGTYKFAADGTLDDVRIYNRALTAQEIAQLYGNAGHWKLEETSGTIAADSSGANNHGTFTSNPTLGQTGVYDLATVFNSATLAEYLALPRAVIHEASTVSASFWIKTTHTGEQAIVSGNNASKDNELLLFFGSHTEFRIYCHGNTQSWTIPSIADGNWHHVAVVSLADTNKTTMYLDKVSMGTKSISAGNTPYSIDVGGLIVAQEQDSVGGGFSNSQCLRGTLDELRLYQRALSDKEIGELFGLMGHWAFNEGAGTTVADSSGAGINASVSGASWTSDCAGNTALSFDGFNDTVATTTSIDPPNKGSVAFWFRSAGTPTRPQRLWGLNTDFEMWQDVDGLIRCDMSTDASEGGSITTSPLDEEDRWYHLVAHYDADTDVYSIYIDGELHKTGISTWDVTDQAPGTLTFGTRTGNTDYFQGSIRDFRIYNRPMFNSEIAKLAGVIARWQLNESNGTVAIDSSLRGNNATYVGNPTLNVGGTNSANGTAVELNGTGQYVTAGKSLLNGLQKFSLSVWVRPDSLTPDKSFVGQNGLIELGIDTQTDRIDFWTTNGGSLSATAPLAMSKWSHVVAVGEGTNLRLYVNGVEVGSGGSSTSNYGTNSGTFKIGEGVLTASGGYFDGRFDDVRVYSRAICPGEVNSIYQGGRPAGVRIIRWIETR